MSRYDISARVVQQLKGERHAPSADTVIFICSYNNVRRDGNEAAHTATQDQVKQAVMSKSVGGMERSHLEQVFEFTYDVDMYEPFSKWYQQQDPRGPETRRTKFEGII